MRVDLLLEHRCHIECVSHCIEADDLWQLLEARPLLCPDLLLTFGAGVHVVAIQSVLDTDLVN